MKSACYFAIVVLVLVMAAAVPGFGQVGGTKVTVPFEFQVGNRILPAGEYLLTQFSGAALIVENREGKGSAMAVTSATGGNGESRNPHLTFHKYGQKYFLAEAWLRYSDAGRMLHVSPAELEIARVTSQGEPVLLALQ